MNSKYNILMVDEDSSALEPLKEYLTAKGHKVVIVNEGQEAMKKIWQHKFHIILIHIELPDRNGLEILKEIRDYDSLAQVIMLSSDSNMDKIIAALEYGANDYIHKPWQQEYLIEVINYSLQKLERWKQSMLYLVQDDLSKVVS